MQARGVTVSFDGLSVGALVFTHGYPQAIGVHVLRDSSTEYLSGFLSAWHAPRNHRFVELIEIRNAQAGATPSGGA
jgi:hypothetical protein